MSCTPCITPSQTTLAFFPGLKGDPGPPGPASTVPGPTGPTGPAGASPAFTDDFDPDRIYYDTEFRKDIVAYNGRFWITNEPSKSGTATWDAPNVDNWADYGTTLVMVATALALLEAQNINVGLNIQSPGYIKSDNLVAFVSGWLLSGAGRFEAYDGVFQGVVSTNTPKFNPESDTRTMPAVARVQFDIGAIADGDITVNPIINNVTDDTLIFFGWNNEPPGFLENRFGNESQKFSITLSVAGSNTSAGSDLFYIQLYYRTRNMGGAWGAWTIIGLDSYMQKIAAVDQTVDITREPTLTLTGDDDVQFSAGFSKGVGGVAAVNAAQITVTAFN